ncbi:histidinol-phosphate transaminase [Flavobacterium psychrophilum]|uniref:histidinol-phosphate transaminase n=1 Tax=Flavobacterium psychrophilum TaxID=96345 RepID=UPI000B7C1EBC|nr:histidinol-phosphate transaminase [Flavobacterium psychrophilum]MCB6097553.1 histidinol-phosphate transaminase [Flavobacterium psychrophilum]SNA79813.1 Histidinol-phosphate aminotransferase [Flavobacterium psychrophilum]
MNNFNINNLVRENIKNMQAYASARDEFKDFTHNMVYLDANENPFSNGINRYPDPQQKKLKGFLSQQNKINENQMLLGNGSDEVLDLVFRAFCEPNVDNVITLPPTYGMYGVLANINAIENKEVLLSANFQPNINEILKNINENTKIIFLCSPNNPTGNSFDDQAVLTLLKNFNGLVVIDEAYIDFSKNGSWLHVISDYPNLLITQTLSKAYAMAGLRIGILYASAAIISILNKIKPPYNINNLSQESALKKLEQSTLNFHVKKIINERKKMVQSLISIPFIEKIYPSDANFILIKVEDANKRYNQLIEKGIVIRNRTNQPLCENCLRITIGTKEENEKLITVLKAL